VQKWLYELIYRVPFVPMSWIFGPLDPVLVELVEGGRIPPGRAIDLCCGAGVEALYLAKQGFEVTGVDFSPTAIRKACRASEQARLPVRFLEDDLTSLRHIHGCFDLLTDFGALNDMNPYAREQYVQKILPLTSSGRYFLLMGLENWLSNEEIKQRFGNNFSVETLAVKPSRSSAARWFITGWCASKVQ
jgi:SAM-dependent methyltransferase